MVGGLLVEITGPLRRKDATVPETYDVIAKRIILNPDESYWLQHAIGALSQRDPLDAVRDAELLAKIQRIRWEEVTSDAE
jgi:hypothetical protein